MSNYLVTPIDGDWIELAKHAAIDISEKDKKLGEEIFSHKPNDYPFTGEAIIMVREHFSSSDPSVFDNALSLSRGEPVHPFELLALMCGVDSKKWVSDYHWTYKSVATTMLLAHPGGQVYTFLLNGYEKGGQFKEKEWSATFLPAGGYLGRSMYAHKIPKRENLGFFKKNQDGKYGEYSSY